MLSSIRNVKFIMHVLKMIITAVCVLFLVIETIFTVAVAKGLNTKFDHTKRRPKRMATPQRN